ncbi:pickpocket protein 19-like [Bactrocera neohumeralis]|uniref:pickpocket protein 19-like n=1 Tax=Bactrocera neohumeralis TaxID=98809 RepID=UPI0021661FFD|nr:pickpocket protein 19-like [Bactrocera neohumeralis]
MAYLHELTYPMSRPRNDLLLFNKASTKTTLTKKPTLCQVVLPYCKGYCDISSLHGVRYLTDPKLYYFERVIWLLLLIATTCGCLYVYDDLADLYYSQRIQTIVDDTVSPIFTKPFPAIGICPRNRINWPKLMEAHEVFLARNASDEVVQTFRRFFAIMGDFSFGEFNHLSRLYRLDLNLTLLDDVNIMEVMRYVGFTCDELFVQPCHWRRNAYNCCDLFSMERTEYGFCFVFNSVVTKRGRERMLKDRYYPYHNAKTNELSGLDVVINLDETKQPPNFTRTNGVYVMVKQPQQWHSDPRFINPNTYTKIPVIPQFTLTDERTRAVGPEERRCFFQNENGHPLYKKIPGLEYRRGNCFTRCHQEYVFKLCKCNLRVFFPQAASDNITACTAKDFKCLYEYREIFKTDNLVAESQYVEAVSNHTMICNCLNNCNQMIYVTNYISMPLEDVNTTDEVKKVHLDVHYASNYMMSYSTRIRYTFVELLANFGGIIGLFLGASLMSGVELFYYFTIGLYTYLRQRGYISSGFNFSLRSSPIVASLKHKKMLKKRKRFLENNNRKFKVQLRH